MQGSGEKVRQVHRGESHMAESARIWRERWGVEAQRRPPCPAGIGEHLERRDLEQEKSSGAVTSPIQDGWSQTPRVHQVQGVVHGKGHLNFTLRQKRKPCRSNSRGPIRETLGWG